ncbi:MAG: winged helix-turn-helix domain-containing protein [bacterium]
MSVIDKLGYVQIDTLAVINRSHHHTIWTRCADYEESLLHELQSQDRRVFEYWGHAMCYMPMADFRYCLPRMRHFENPTSQWAQYQMQQSGHLLEPVLERIREEGPLSSKDFKTAPDQKRGSWWDWKPAKVALELLFWKGDLMISQRRNFQKVYDLTERVLPDDIDTSYPTDEELGRFFVRRALRSLGLALEKEIHSFMQPESSRDADIQAVSNEVISQTLRDLLEAGEVQNVRLVENPDTEYFALQETVEKNATLKNSASQIHLLSPFDNLIIQRSRIKRLFGFDYALECYLPAAKRTYGYFVLPILWKEEFIARADVKADKKQKVLFIHNLIFEPGFKLTEGFLHHFSKKAGALARFNLCDKIELKNVDPAEYKRPLSQKLNT